MAGSKYDKLGDERGERIWESYRKKLDIAAVKMGRKGVGINDKTLREGFFSAIAKADKERANHKYKIALGDYIAAAKFAEKDGDVDLLEMVEKRVYRLAKQIDKEESGHKYEEAKKGPRGRPLYDIVSNFGESLELGINKIKGARTKKGEGLEKAAATVAVIGILGGIFFLSFNITGNMIGNPSTAGNVTGVILFILGLVGALFYFKKIKN